MNHGTTPFLKPAREGPPSPGLAWLLLLGLGIVAWHWPGAGRLVADPPFQDFLCSMSASEISRSQPDAPVQLEGSWDLLKGMLLVPSGQPGNSIRVVAPAGPWDGARVIPRGEVESRWTVAVTVRPPEGSGGPIASQTYFRVTEDEGLWIDGEDFPLAGTPTVEVRPDGGSVDGLFHLDVRLEARRLDPLPHLPDFAALLLAPLAAGWFLRIVLGLGMQRSFVGGAGIGLLVLAMWRTNAAEPGAAWALTVGIAGAAGLQALAAARGVSPRRRELPGVDLRRAGLWLAGGAVVLLALGARWDALVDARRLPMAPDEATGPLAGWVLAAWNLAVPESEASARLLWTLASTAGVAALVWAGTRLLGGWAGLAGGAVLALSPALVEAAPEAGAEGLALVLLGVALAVAARPPARGEASAAAQGAVWGGLVLSGLALVPAGAVALGCSGRRERWRAGGWGAGVGLLAAAVAAWFMAGEGPREVTLAVESSRLLPAGPWWLLAAAAPGWWVIWRRGQGWLLAVLVLAGLACWGAGQALVAWGWALGAKEAALWGWRQGRGWLEARRAGER